MLFKNSLVVTEFKDSPLFNIAKKNNCTLLEHKKDIGGRYSIFSNVGMIPAILAGLDVKKIHLGASKVFEKNGSPAQPPAKPPAKPLASSGPSLHLYITSFLRDELALSASPKAAPLPLMLLPLTLRGTNAQRVSRACVMRMHSVSRKLTSNLSARR